MTLTRRWMVNLPNRVPPEFGKLGSMSFEGWFHERTLGIAARLLGSATLVLFFDQPAGAVGLGGGS